MKNIIFLICFLCLSCDVSVEVEPIEIDIKCFPGEYECICYPNDTCNAELTCVNDICVFLDDTTTYATTDTGTYTGTTADTGTTDSDSDTDTGTTTWTLCMNKGSINFTGSPAGLVADWSSSLNASYNNLTAELWLRDGGGIHPCNYILTSYNSNCTGPVWLAQCSDPALEDGNWHHAARVWDLATNEIRLYIDGALADTLAYSVATIGAQGLYIGGSCNSGGTNYFDGNIQGLRISNSVRYASTFTPSTEYGSDGNTLLFVPMTTSVAGEAIDYGPFSIPITNNDNAEEGIDGPYCYDPL